MFRRQIREAQVQAMTEVSATAEATRQSRVPGKASKVNIIVSVPKTDTGRRGE